MRAGQFNFKEWMNKLYEEVDENEDKDENPQKVQAEKSTASSDFMDGGEDIANNDGIVMPNDNKKSYDWLKKEFQKGKVEVKVEMKVGGSTFTPVNDMQADPDSVKDFKPGMFGEVKTANPENGEKNNTKPETSGNLDPKKDKPAFNKGESEKTPGEKPENGEKAPEKAPPFKKKETAPSKGKKPEDDEKSTEEKDDKKDEAEVKKVDLKTKKK